MSIVPFRHCFRALLVLSLLLTGGLSSGSTPAWAGADGDHLAAADGTDCPARMLLAPNDEAPEPDTGQHDAEPCKRRRVETDVVSPQRDPAVAAMAMACQGPPVIPVDQHRPATPGPLRGESRFLRACRGRAPPLG